MRVWIMEDEYQRPYLLTTEPTWPEVEVDMPDEMIARFNAAVAELEAVNNAIEALIVEQGADAVVVQKRREQSAARMKKAEEDRVQQVAANRKEYLGL